MVARKPKNLNSSAEKELDNAQKQFDKFENEIKDLTLDRMNQAPKIEADQQTQISRSEIQKKPDHYLKPKRTIGSREKFNERFREDYNFKREYVQFIAENKEIIGESIPMWTKPFPGVPAEEWEVPVNKPIWGPRYLAEQIKGCKYHKLSMQNSMTNSDGIGQFYGSMVVDNTIQRLDAIPVSQHKSVFVGASF